MKPTLIFITCLFILVMLLTGCVAVPYPEPVAYSPPPATVVVRPAPRYHYHYRHEPYWRRGWR